MGHFFLRDQFSHRDISIRKKGTEGTRHSSLSSPSSFSSLAPPRSVSVLDIPVHDVTYAETSALVEAFVAQGGPHQICTANPEFVAGDVESVELQEQFDIILM